MGYLRHETTVDTLAFLELARRTLRKFMFEIGRIERTTVCGLPSLPFISEDLAIEESGIASFWLWCLQLEDPVERESPRGEFSSSLEFHLPLSNRAAAVASVACPQRGTSSLIVNQRSENSEARRPMRWKVGGESFFTHHNDLVLDINTFRLTRIEATRTPHQ